jgi:hypothetical protein
MADLLGFTRNLMGQMELDLETRRDWIAVDHHNTGQAISRMAQRLMEIGLATVKDGRIRVAVSAVAIVERQDVERVGRRMARESGLADMPANAGDYVSGRLAGTSDFSVDASP